MKVMVVDDEPDVQILFEQRFRKELRAGKIEFCFFLSGEAALEYLDKQSTADLVLILSDINMPGMNGFELLKGIKARYTEIKVFMVTAYGDEQNYQHAMSNGADGFINKPIDFEQLKNQIFAA